MPKSLTLVISPFLKGIKGWFEELGLRAIGGHVGLGV